MPMFTNRSAGLKLCAWRRSRAFPTLYPSSNALTAEDRWAGKGITVLSVSVSWSGCPGGRHVPAIRGARRRIRKRAAPGDAGPPFVSQLTAPILEEDTQQRKNGCAVGGFRAPNQRWRVRASPEFGADEARGCPERPAARRSLLAPICGYLAEGRRLERAERGAHGRLCDNA